MVEQCYYENVLVYSSKKSRFMKEEEAKGILSSLHIKTLLKSFHY